LYTHILPPVIELVLYQYNERAKEFRTSSWRTFLDCGGKRSAAPLYSLPLRSPITCLAIPQNYPARLIDLAFSCEAGQRKAVWRYASPPHSKNAAVIEETGAITTPRN